ncbi:MAG: PAS domain-containing protein, partial [Caulobacteraceae bacterium]
MSSFDQDADSAQRLRESEARLLALTQASSDVLYRMSPDWAEMRELNGGAFLAAATSPNRDWLMKYIPPSDQGAVTAAIEQAIETKSPFALEHRVIRHDGGLGWTLSRAVPILNAAGELVEWFGAAADITAKREAEEQLRRLNETLESKVAARTAERDSLWETSPDLLLVIDFDGVFRRVNPAWTVVLGYFPDELLGRHVNAFVAPKDHLQTTAAYQFAAVGGRPRVENRYRHKDGSLRWISWVAAPAGDVIYATGRDVTEQREQEQVLRDSQDFARLALSAVGGVGVWSFDVASDRFFFDAGIADLYALKVEDGEAGLLRADFLANVVPEDLAALRTTMAGGLITPGDLELEYRIRHPDGAVRHVLSRGHTYFNAQGQPVRRTGVGIDTTSRHVLQEQLRQAQKMEAVGQLTGGLAHDFNNLLAGISGSLEIMETRIRQGRLQDVERYLIAAQGAARRAASLTHRLLAFSRRQTLDPKPTDVNRLVTGLQEL